VLGGDLYAIQSRRRVVLGNDTAENLDVEMGKGVVASFLDANTINLIVSIAFIRE